MTVKSFFGGLLMVVGGLVAVFSGLCSIWGIVGSMTSSQGPENFFSFGAVAMFGGIPFVIGLGLYKWGQWLRGKKDKNPDVIK